VHISCNYIFNYN